VPSAKALATLLHLHRGTPYIYQGEELGMTNYPFTSLDQIVDVEGINFAREAREKGRTDAEILSGIRAHGRDNARTPMQWDATEQAGFTTGTAWLPVNPNHTTINAAAQVDDPDSVFTHYQRLIQLRHDEPVVALGDVTMLLENHPQVYAFTRRLDDTELLVMVNVSSNDAHAPLDDADGWSGAHVVLGQPYHPTMAPWEQRVLRRSVDG
jgi:oligo-1,6-glucosidase